MANGQNLVPWNIRAIPEGIRDTITKAARLEDVTVGVWLTRRVSEWVADGSPVQVSPETETNMHDGEATLSMVRDAAAYMNAAAAMHAAGLPVNKAALTGMQAAVASKIRQVRGLPPLAPRLPPRPVPHSLAAPEGAGAPPAEPGKARTLPGG